MACWGGGGHLCSRPNERRRREEAGQHYNHTNGIGKEVGFGLILVQWQVANRSQEHLTAKVFQLSKAT